MQAPVTVIERAAGVAPEASPPRRKPKVARKRPSAPPDVLDPPEPPYLRRGPSTHPYDHTRREGNGGVGLATDFCWRHTWVHDTTGERIVATVPIPPSGDPFEDAEGLVVRRRVEHAIEVQRHLPTARVEVFTAEGALVGHVAPVDEAAPSTSPAPEVPHPYGEGLW